MLKQYTILYNKFDEFGKYEICKYMYPVLNYESID